MNEKQVAFIICADSMQYYEECTKYINNLTVPEGYSTDIIGIWEADSMAAGYNAAMAESSARYKVYLHQDTFILNRNFIADIIKLLEEDETVGLIAMIGTDALSADKACRPAWNIGSVKAYDGKSSVGMEFMQSPGRKYMEAEAAAGFLMVTRQDFSWEEDGGSPWEGYDVRHSLKIRQQGYKVAVPCQENPWCYHDGIICASENESTQFETIRIKMEELMEAGAYKALKEITQQLREIWPEDMEIREIISLMEIYTLEEESVNENHSRWFLGCSWEGMREAYRALRFALLEIRYLSQGESLQKLKEELDGGRISKDAVRKVSGILFRDTSEIYHALQKEEKQEALVSVIVAVYNGEAVIGETLKSVLNQTYKNMEVIVVDDGSVDSSREVIASFEDARIKPVFLEKNHHVCYAGNMGFEQAAGKYVALIGHDDLWREDKLEKQVRFLEEHPGYSVCFTWAEIIDEENQSVNDLWPALYERFCGDNYGWERWSKKLFLEGNHFCAPSACIRRESLERTGYYRYGLVQLQDYDLWLRLLLQGPVYRLSEKLTYYRRFRQEGINISSQSMDTILRDNHENQWIRDDYINGLTAGRFAAIFNQHMKNPCAEGEIEIQCEKAFLLWAVGNCFALRWFLELLESKEGRRILEEKYDFEPKDFYKLNAAPRIFDTALLSKVREQEQLLEKYRRTEP